MKVCWWFDGGLLEPGGGLGREQRDGEWAMENGKWKRRYGKAKMIGSLGGRAKVGGRERIWSGRLISKIDSAAVWPR